MGLRYWSQPTPIGEITVVVGDAGVCAVSLPGGAPEPAAGARAEHDDAVALQLDEYFEGNRRAFDLPVDLSSVSAPFRLEVLQTLQREVPWGETVTYGELAAMAGRPRAARAVGTAMAHNPVPLFVPCHRVVASGGIGGYGRSPQAVPMKRTLLALEGIHVR
jgi:methylated-DNA-[protein]-cysteine S-methyltransferase